MTMIENARCFFDTCETGKGWSECVQYCHPQATFSCQSDVLAETNSLEAYSEWMKELLTPIPDGHYELKGFAEDTDRQVVMAFAVFHGTNSADGGPIAPTGKKVAADYVYIMEFSNDKVIHMTKIWNDMHSLKSLGWA
jgi:predicted ester cyclase